MDLITAAELLNDSSKTPSDHVKMIKRWRDVYYGISLHTTGACPKFRDLSTGSGTEVIPPYYFGEEYQCLFERYLFSKHPREHDLTRQWRFSQYKPLTRAPFQQIIDIIIGAIFQDSNYSIDIQNKDDHEYIWGNNFSNYDLIGWFSNIAMPNIVEDPNGLILRIPAKPYYDQTGGRVMVSIWFINTKDIIYFDKDTLIFKRDRYAYYVDNQVIYRFSKNDESKWVIATEDAEGYYAHMLGKLPVDVAGGIWNSQGFYDSFLMKAKAIADEFISSYSAEQMVDKEASHPFIVLANEECPTCKGVKQIQEECDDCPGGYDLVDCKVCGGKGTVSVSPGDRIYASAEDMKGDLVKIVNPDVGINTYHHEKNIDIYERILHALNLYKTDKAESGEAKAIDQERLYQFISKISNHLFDKLIYGTITDVIAYRNLGVVNGVLMPVNNPFSVQKPTQFQMKTAADLLSEYKSGKDSDMPTFVRNRMVSDFVDKQYSGDPVMKRKSKIILELDDVGVLGADEVLTMSTIGTIQKEHIIFSLKLPSILDTLIRLKGESWFIDTPFDTIKAEVESIFEKFKPEPLFKVEDEPLLPINT